MKLQFEVTVKPLKSQRFKFFSRICGYSEIDPDVWAFDPQPIMDFELKEEVEQSKLNLTLDQQNEVVRVFTVEVKDLAELKHLELTQQIQLCNLLLECSSVRDRRTLRTIINSLPNILESVDDTGRLKTYIMNVINTCQTFTGELVNFLYLVREFDEGSASKAKLDDFLLSLLMKQAFD